MKNSKTGQEEKESEDDLAELMEKEFEETMVREMDQNLSQGQNSDYIRMTDGMDAI